MALSDAIRKRGFRRWYERQLYEGFAYMITGLLSLIAIAVALEMIEFRKSFGGFLTLAAIAAAGCGLCYYSWRQFTSRLALAEYLAARATCTACHVYGRFEVQAVAPEPASPAGCLMHVRCRKCGYEWRID